MTKMKTKMKTTRPVPPEVAQHISPTQQPIEPEVLQLLEAAHLDADENVKDMRAVAKTVGLTALLVRANRSTDSRRTKTLIRQALGLLGVRS